MTSTLHSTHLKTLCMHINHNRPALESTQSLATKNASTKGARNIRRGTQRLPSKSAWLGPFPKKTVLGRLLTNDKSAGCTTHGITTAVPQKHMGMSSSASLLVLLGKYICECRNNCGVPTPGGPSQTNLTSLTCAIDQSDALGFPAGTLRFANSP